MRIAPNTRCQRVLVLVLWLAGCCCIQCSVLCSADSEDQRWESALLSPGTERGGQRHAPCHRDADETVLDRGTVSQTFVRRSCQNSADHQQRKVSTVLLSVFKFCALSILLRDRYTHGVADCLFCTLQKVRHNRHYDSEAGEVR